MNVSTLNPNAAPGTEYWLAAAQDAKSVGAALGALPTLDCEVDPA